MPRRYEGSSCWRGYNRCIMKDSEIIFAVEESAEGGYQALGRSIITEADSMDELKQMVRDAVRCHFEPHEMPAIIRLHFVRDEVIFA
jgi:hypothetical protein